jgi:hypothetical protein
MIHRGLSTITFILIMAKINIDNQLLNAKIHDVHDFSNI